MQAVIGAIPGPLTRAQQRQLATVEYERLLALLDTLEPEDWTRQTDCPAWTVREMTAHLLGAAQSNASLWTSASQVLAAQRLDRRRALVDRINDIQVARQAGVTPERLREELRRIAPAAVAGRWKVPGLMRRMTVGDSTGVQFSMGQLLDVVYTRDVWMHRVDISRATGRRMELTAGHDGLLLGDIVRDWAQGHGQPFVLRLTGPAGATYRSGEGGGEFELDAVEFARALSGRTVIPGLLLAPVPF